MPRVPFRNLRTVFSARRFPPPWSVEEQSPCYVVRDFDGQALGYGYFEDEPGRRCVSKTLSKRISEN
jgi:hypothetical protein